GSRCVVQLILRPWRQLPSYGWRQLGLTATLALAFTLNLESFALGKNGRWLWQSTATAGGAAAALIHFACFWVVALLFLVLATPMLLKKRPVEPPPPLHQLAVWTSLNLFF